MAVCGHDGPGRPRSPPPPSAPFLSSAGALVADGDCWGPPRPARGSLRGGGEWLNLLSAAVTAGTQRSVDTGSGVRRKLVSGALPVTSSLAAAHTFRSEGAAAAAPAGGGGGRGWQKRAERLRAPQPGTPRVPFHPKRGEWSACAPELWPPPTPPFARDLKSGHTEEQACGESGDPSPSRDPRPPGARHLPRVAAVPAAPPPHRRPCRGQAADGQARGDSACSPAPAVAKGCDLCAVW